MWVFTNTAFVSAVADRDDPSRLMLRARLKGDLEAFLARVVAVPDIVETPDADYRFRTVVRREEFLVALDHAARAIDYDNFKSSIAPDQRARHDAYLDVWSVMHEAQHSA
ncbi:MAG: hypothetical protein V4530_11120 [Pseudomonadota bacterium]